MSPDTPTGSSTIQKTQLICGFILGTTVMYAVVGFGMVLLEVMPEGGFVDVDEDSHAVVNGALIVIGILSVAASFPVKRLLTRRIEPGQGPEARLKVALSSMAMAETGGVLALVSILVTGELGAAAILFGVAVGAGVFHFPTRSWLEGDA